MLKNYFLIATRFLLKNKLYTFLNLFGLAIGISACLIIFSYVRYQLSYDTFHAQADQVQKLNLVLKIEGDVKNIAVTPAAVLEDLKEEISAIIDGARVYAPSTFGRITVSYQDNHYNEPNFYFADPAFLDMFDFPIISGNVRTALAEPNQVLITPSAASKYFGDESPEGKIIQVKGYEDHIITGVIDDPPDNSAFQFDFLASFSALNPSTEWESANYYTFLKLSEDADPAEVLEQCNLVMEKRKVGSIFERSDSYFGLVPLTELHYSSIYEFEIGKPIDKATLLIFPAIAIFILIVACINYINLSTARSADRAHEIGLRKSLGAGQGQLFGQFMSEAFIITAGAVTFSVGLTYIMMPWLNQITGIELAPEIFNLNALLPGILLLIMVAFLAGSYPSLSLSTLNPKTALQPSERMFLGRNRLRQSLVIFQFVLSISLITGTLVIYKQMNYLRKKDLGFKGEQVMIASINGRSFDRSRFEGLKKELEQQAVINSVSFSSAVPGNNSGGQLGTSKHTKQQVLLWEWKVQPDFINTMKMEIITGEDFSSFGRDTNLDNYCVVNEKAAVELGYSQDNIVGQQVLINDQPFECIGVVKDFHMASLHQKIDPVVIRVSDDWISYVIFKFNSGDVASAKKAVEDQWRIAMTDVPFDYFFLDHNFARLLEQDLKTGKILTMFAVTAILIAALGLLGLISFNTVKRSREIGIRKVLGSSEIGILLLLIKETFYLILIASLVALPAGYWAIDKWLQDFAFRIDFPYDIFPVAVMAALLMMLSTVSYHAYKAAKMNPVTVLKRE